MKSRLIQFGRWFFGLVSLGMGINYVFYLWGVVAKDHDWMAHIFSMLMMGCCFATALGLLAWKRWFYPPAVLVALAALIEGFGGILVARFLGARVSVLGLSGWAVSALIGFFGVSFFVWLRSRDVCTWRSAVTR